MSAVQDAAELRRVESCAAGIAACFPVLRQLRPHLADAAALVAQVGRQQREGYRLLAACRDGEGTEAALGVAGYRLQENLIYGRFVYVDDLAVLDGKRRARLGARLLDAVASEAATEGCRRLVLDTGLANALAQRFYFRNGLLASALRFSRDLDIGIGDQG